MLLNKEILGNKQNCLKFQLNKKFCNFSYIRSSEDISSSGYSSAEPMSVGLSRTASMTNATRARIKARKPEVRFFYFYW